MDNHMQPATPAVSGKSLAVPSARAAPSEVMLKNVTLDPSFGDAMAEWYDRLEKEQQRIVVKFARNYARRQARKRNLAYEFGSLCEATEGLAKYWRDHGVLNPEVMLRYADGDRFCLMAMEPFLRDSLGSFTFSKIKRMLSRPFSYAKEKAARDERNKFEKDRRKITDRITSADMPTKFEILDAWLNRNISHAHYMHFGSLLEDLECYVSNKLIIVDGRIVGRDKGIKGWLKEHLPELEHCYSTIMRCKAAAKRMRQLADISDPTPLTDALPEKERLAAIADSRKAFAAAKPQDQTDGSAASPSPETAKRPAVSPAMAKSMAIVADVLKRAPKGPTKLIKMIDEMLSLRAKKES